MGEFALLDKESLEKILWLGTPSFSQNLSKPILDKTGVHRVKRGSTQFHMAAEKFAESILVKLN
ncbi:hypothetical protein [Rothia sp. LK2492]|uniref:hypothetical protein n=1 Tax=Rothia sp. LK2492 TaxID=3114370 RepID=UPI0034CD23B1